MEISQVRALRNRLIVFSVPVRRKTKNGLYVYNSKRAQYFGGEDVWVISAGDRVHEEALKPGARAMVNDGMELEPSDLELWNDFKDNPLFAELKAYVEEVDGEVRTQIITEDSVIAVYE